MDNIYGNTAEAGEGSSLNILEPGVHKVYIEDIEVLKVTTSKYDGEVADIKLAGVNGGTISARIFPFQHQEGRTDFNGNTLDMAAQVKEYFSKLNHLMFKAAGSEDRYTAAVQGATSFSGLMNRAKSVATRTNGGSSYWQMIITDANNYSRVPMWKGGCCESVNGDFPSTLVFDASKHGKKAPENTESASSGVNQLPFDVE